MDQDEIGKCKIDDQLYHVMAHKEDLNEEAFVHIHLTPDEALFGEPAFKSTLKIWTVWEERVSLEGDSKESICSLKENSPSLNLEGKFNVLHVEAVVIINQKAKSIEMIFQGESSSGAVNEKEEELEMTDEEELVIALGEESFMASSCETEVEKVCLAVKRIAYEMFMSSPSELKEMHLLLTKDLKDGGLGWAEPDEYEIKREPWSERIIGWGTPFNIEKVSEYPSIPVYP